MSASCVGITFWFTLLLSRMKMLSKVNHALKDEVFLSSFLKLIKKKTRLHGTGLSEKYIITKLTTSLFS